MRWHGMPCLLLNLEIKACGISDCPYDPQGILIEPFIGVLYTADHFFLKILHAAIRIDQTASVIICHSVDRKIPPHQVICDIRRERDLQKIGAFLISRVDPVGRDLISVFSDKDCHRSAPVFRISRPGEHRFHLFRECGCGYIPFPRLPCKNRVTHTSSDSEGLIPVFFQFFNYSLYLFRQSEFHGCTPSFTGIFKTGIFKSSQNFPLNRETGCRKPEQPVSARLSCFILVPNSKAWGLILYPMSKISFILRIHLTSKVTRILRQRLISLAPVYKFASLLAAADAGSILRSLRLVTKRHAP